MNAYKYFAYYYDEIMKGLNYDLWLEFTEQYLKRGDKVLDLACGTGTLCNMYALHGYKASGLDLSAPIIEVAREKSRINHLKIEYYIQDMTNFKINETYDVITCFFDSINFLKSNKDIKNMLDCVCRHLKTGGYFICDVFSRTLFDEYEHEEIHDDYETYTLDWITEQYNKNTLKHSMTVSEEGEKPLHEEYFEYYHDIKHIKHPKLILRKVVGDFNDDLKPDDERILMVFIKL